MTDKRKPFVQDEEGMITPRSLVGWELGKFEETVLLVQLRHAGSQAELDQGGLPLLLCLNPHQAVELAGELQKHARSLLEQKSGSPKN